MTQTYNFNGELEDVWFEKTFPEVVKKERTWISGIPKTYEKQLISLSTERMCCYPCLDDDIVFCSNRGTNHSIFSFLLDRNVDVILCKKHKKHRYM